MDGLRGWWRWWRELDQNPIYRRERGDWGRPNAYYNHLKRYSPFLVIGAIMLGFCASGMGLFQMAESDLMVMWCFLFVPTTLRTMLALFGTFMAPAVTAPAISYERSLGTWDILRLTPHSTTAILLAKLFGGLARLKIWTLLLGLTIFEGVLWLLAAAFSQQPWPVAFTGIAAVLLRPWLELLCAACLGMVLSISLRSATVALATSYVVFILLKIGNSLLIWTIFLESLDWNPAHHIYTTNLLSAGTYLLVLVLLFALLHRQGERVAASPAIVSS